MEAGRDCGRHQAEFTELHDVPLALLSGELRNDVGNTRRSPDGCTEFASRDNIFHACIQESRGVRKVRFGRMPAPPPTSKLARALARLIGGTPLLEIHCRYRGREQRIYAKHEAYNFTGSIKDRMALYILQRAYASGEIEPGDVIAEATSGNTGISFAAIGRALGHPVRIYMPDWMSRERVLVIQSLGAAVIPVSAELGGFLGSIRMADDFAREGGRVFRPQQFDNTANVQAHYETTGPGDHRAARRRSAAGPPPSSPASARAAPSWAWRSICASASAKESRRIRSSPPTRRRCAPVTRSAGTASRESATSSCRRS